MREFVRTDQGSGWVQTMPIVRSGAISILTKDATLRRTDESDTILPTGTFIRRDARLTRETAKKSASEQRTHQILEEGAHAAARQCLHIQRFERGDGAEMLKRLPQITRIAQEIYVCGQLEFSFHEKITQNLAFCREASFNENKTAPKKVEVREHLDTANAQRSKSGRLKAMPASSAVLGSKRDVDARFKETAAIHAVFNINYIAVDEMLQEAWGCLDILWKQIGPAGTANATIGRAMHQMTRDRATIRTAKTSVQAAIENLSLIKIQPYLPLAQAASEACKDLHWSIDNCRRARAGQALERVRYLLRRMRMLWFVERSLIFVLSFPSADGTHRPRAVEVFHERLVKAESRVANMEDVDFDPELRKTVREYLEATRTNVEAGDHERARAELKHLTHLLRVLPA